MALPIDLGHTLRIDARPTNRGKLVGRNRALLGPALAGEDLHAQPLCELVLLGPHPSHLGVGVAIDHRLLSACPTLGRGRRAGSAPAARWTSSRAAMSRRNCRPSN